MARSAGAGGAAKAEAVGLRPRRAVWPSFSLHHTASGGLPGVQKSWSGTHHLNLGGSCMVCCKGKGGEGQEARPALRETRSSQCCGACRCLGKRRAFALLESLASLLLAYDSALRKASRAFLGCADLSPRKPQVCVFLSLLLCPLNVFGFLFPPGLHLLRLSGGV